MIVATLRSMLRDRSRTAASVLAVTLVVVLVAIPSAIRESAITKPQNYLKRSGADAFVMAPGVVDYISQSVLGPADLDSVSAREGIDETMPSVVGFATLHTDSEPVSVVIQSFEPGMGYGGPWKLAEGRSVGSDDEIVVDASLAEQFDLRVGSVVELGAGSFRVVGLSEETAAIGKQLVFVTTEAAQRRVYDNPTLVTHLLVRSGDASGFVDSARSAGLSAYERADLTERNQRYWTRQIGPTFDMMLLVVVVFGSLLLLTLFLMSNRSRRRHLAVQSALGVPLRSQVAAELVTALLLTVVGVVIGLGLAVVGLGAVNKGSPGLDASLTPELLARAGVLVALIVLLALVPTLFALRRIDPADALAEPS